MKLIATIFLAVLIISGCGSKKVNQVGNLYRPLDASDTLEKQDILYKTINMQDIFETTSTVPPEHLSFTFGADLITKRKDLYRQRSAGNKKWYDPDGYTVPYQYIGLYLGNGLFIDAYKNLSIDILNYFNIDIKKSELKFTYSQNKEGGYTTLRHEDGKIKVQYSLDEEPFLIMEYIDNILLYSFDNWMQEDDKIYFEKETIYFDGISDEEIVKESETLYVVPHFLEDYDFEMIGPDTLDLEDVLVIRLDDEIQICDDNPDVLEDGSYEVMKHIICKNDGFVCYDHLYKGFSARRKADTIFVYENKELSYRIEIEKIRS